MDPVTLDALDLRLLHALQLDGRAPFSRIAEVLEVSDRTVARRFNRLRSAGAARVAGVVDSRRTGQAVWLVRLRVMPSAAPSLALALARRPDTSWVTIASSGTEVVSLFRVEDEGAAPVAALGSRAEVTQIDAQRLLRPMMEHRWVGRTSALSGEQIDALRPVSPGEADVVRPTGLDRHLLPALAADGRVAYPQLARQVGWSESAVRRRVDELRRSGAVRFDVEVDSGLFGFSVQCLLWLTVKPAQLDVVARALARDAEAAFVGTMTGAFNLLVIAVCRDGDALHTYLAARIGSFEGVDRLETSLIASYSKRAAPTAAARR